MEQFKARDIVVCIPGYADGGAGWTEGAIFDVTKVTNESGGRVAWYARAGCGVWIKSLRLATEKEIEHYNKGIRNIADIPKEPIYELY